MLDAGCLVLGSRSDDAEFLQDLADLAHGSINRVVDNLKRIFVGVGQFVAGHFEPPLNGLFRFGSASPQAALQLSFGTGPQKNGGHVWELAADLFRPVDINIQNNPFRVIWARSDLAKE